MPLVDEVVLSVFIGDRGQVAGSSSDGQKPTCSPFNMLVF